MPLTVRPAEVPADYEAIAHVLRAEMGEWAPSAEDLAYADASRDPGHSWAAFVAEEPGLWPSPLVGVASVGHDPRAHRPDKLLLNIRVPPELQGRGIGARLYDAVMGHIAPLAPCELQTDVWWSLERAIRFVADRGFVEVWRRYDSELEVDAFDEAPYAGLAGRVAAAGVELRTYAELAGDPGRLAKLHALDAALWRDIPYGEPVTPPSLGQFEREMVENPDFLPDACFVALRSGEYVGYSCLFAGEGYLNVDMTGVLPAYRGMGIATLLKLHGLRYARTRGVPRLCTVNDSVNTAMLALNRKLGFQKVGETIRFLKRLA
jgi:mycothiol synthase